PQKKNPDVLELARGKTGQVVGNMIDLIVNLKGLPMTYNRDLQEDKRGLWASVDTVESVARIIAALLAKVDVDESKALAGFGKGYALATDIAEFLVVKGVPFREAHAVVGRLVGWCIENGLAFSDLTAKQWREHGIDESVREILSVQQSVKRRDVYGGTGFAQVEKQILDAENRLQ
ncbi:MAG: argininosuccinate lyase, partial [Synergistaceae bacterium]|nr:argininosuccinate lyase [Synergistaceae bacterium]